MTSSEALAEYYFDNKFSFEETTTLVYKHKVRETLCSYFNFLTGLVSYTEQLELHLQQLFEYFHTMSSLFLKSNLNTATENEFRQYLNKISQLIDAKKINVMQTVDLIRKILKKHTTYVQQIAIILSGI